DLFFGALDGERMIGMTMLRGWDKGYEVPSFGIMIDREHRGRGLGRCMTELTIDAAREQRCRQIRLSVYASNPRAERLYRRLGFVEVERVPRTECSRPDERIVMTLDLEPRS